ncbi:MAG: ROK family protein [Synergistaceae bacterium]|nr:ROK family protein [Synergistaceae bacterium]
MKYYAGIDIGGTNIKAGIVDETGKILIEDSIPTGADRPQDIVLKDIIAQVKGLAEKSGVALSGVGMGSPGMIDSERGIVIYNNNLGWRNFAIGPAVSEALGVPATLENDADAAALGEVVSGCAKGAKRALIITLGTGVGSGFVIDGRIFRGCEFGHMVIVRGGRPCTCGRKGCFESYCSATGLINMTREAGITEADGTVNGRTVFDAADNGSSKAQDIIDDYTGYLACGLANLINGLLPEVVGLGGGIAKQGERLLAPLREKLKEEIYKGLSLPRIVSCELGYKAGLIGAAMSARQ